jgi:hypothetical protein
VIEYDYKLYDMNIETKKAHDFGLLLILAAQIVKIKYIRNKFRKINHKETKFSFKTQTPLDKNNIFQEI